MTKELLEKTTNPERMIRLAKDKKVISESLDSYFPHLELETENKEIIDFLNFANLQIQQLKSDLLTQLNEL